MSLFCEEMSLNSYIITLDDGAKITASYMENGITFKNEILYEKQCADEHKVIFNGKLMNYHFHEGEMIILDKNGDEIFKYEGNFNEENLPHGKGWCIFPDLEISLSSLPHCFDGDWIDGQIDFTKECEYDYADQNGIEQTFSGLPNDILVQISKFRILPEYMQQFVDVMKNIVISKH